MKTRIALRLRAVAALAVAVLTLGAAGSSVCSNAATIQLYGFSTALAGGATCGSISTTGAFRSP